MTDLRTVAILDTETTGVDSAKDRIVEVAVVLWSVEHGCVLTAWSDLIAADGNPAEHVNRIPGAALKARGRSLAYVMELTAAYCGQADAIVAHNGSFDRGFLTAAGYTSALPWICTLEDVEWPRPSSSQALIAIALAHDVGIVQAHRALADCMMIARLFERVTELGHSPKAMLERGLRPKRLYEALVSFADKDLAKAASFRWKEYQPGQKNKWLRRMVPEDAAVLPFKVREWPEL